MEKIRYRARPFSPIQVRLSDGPIKDRMELTKSYLLDLDADRLLHNFRTTAGLPSSAEPLTGGWEAPTCELRGHFTGHFISACALMYASTGDERLKDKAGYLVAELAECQRKHGNGYLSAFPEEFFDRLEAGKPVWAPWYTLHKIFAGMLDAYLHCGNEEALDVLKQMTDWAGSRLGKFSEDEMQKILKVEFGGMPEVLLNLYALTSDPNHPALAKRFEHKSVLEPMAEQKDRLKGLHANTQIQKAIAAARAYELTGEPRCRDAAYFFQRQVVDARSYATGGTSNYEEWLTEPYYLSNQLSANTHECCCVHNMLKLTRMLFQWTPDARFFDYYERAFYNGILPTQHPADGGAIMYYVPMISGMYKLFNDSKRAFMCCSGTGIESFAKMGDSIYYHDDEGLYVNLFIASELDWSERGLRVRQETGFPEEEKTSLIISTSRPKNLKIRIRVPYWATKGVEISVNQELLNDVHLPGSYSEIDRTWKNGDRVDVRLPMSLHLHRMPDNPDMAAIMYGPIVLAGDLGTERMSPEKQNGIDIEIDQMERQDAAKKAPDLVVAGSCPEDWIKPVEGEPLTFRTDGVGRPEDVLLIPFHKLFGRRYALYWKLYTQKDWDIKQSQSVTLPPGIFDRVIVGDPRSDEEHNRQTLRFETGEAWGRKWIRSPHFFKYDVRVLPDRPMFLECTYHGEDNDVSFDVLIDGKKMNIQPPRTRVDSKPVVITYPVPEEMTKGKTVVAVMFMSTAGQEGTRRSTPRFFGCDIRVGE